MGKYDKFFALAKEAGLTEVELYISESRSLSISMFHGEVDEYKDNNLFPVWQYLKNHFKLLTL